MSYRELALVYDTPAALEFALATVRITRDLSERLGIAPGRLLDLACGTGTFALEMATAGWEVTGLDASAAMIARAESKAAGLGDRAPRFVVGDLRELGLRGPFNLVTCYGAGFNHLPEDSDLTAVFERVRALLAPDGAFLFDTATATRYQSHWGDRVAVEDTPDAFIAVRRTFAPASGRGEADYVIFLREDDRYVRFEDRVAERYYPPNVVAAALRAAGFHDVTREALGGLGMAMGADTFDLRVVRPG